GDRVGEQLDDQWPFHDGHDLAVVVASVPQTADLAGTRLDQRDAALALSQRFENRVQGVLDGVTLCHSFGYRRATTLAEGILARGASRGSRWGGLAPTLETSGALT